MSEERHRPLELSEGRVCWFRRVGAESHPAMLPSSLFAELNHFTAGSWRHREYATRREAVAALALAEENVVRRRDGLFVAAPGPLPPPVVGVVVPKPKKEPVPRGAVCGWCKVAFVDEGRSKGTPKKYCSADCRRSSRVATARDRRWLTRTGR